MKVAIAQQEFPWVKRIIAQAGLIKVSSVKVQLVDERLMKRSTSWSKERLLGVGEEAQADGSPLFRSYWIVRSSQAISLNRLDNDGLARQTINDRLLQATLSQEIRRDGPVSYVVEVIGSAKWRDAGRIIIYKWKDFDLNRLLSKEWAERTNGLLSM